MGIAVPTDRLPSASDSQAVIDLIRQIVHALQAGSHEAQKAVGLSGAQLFILQILAESNPMSVNELAARSYTHQSSVSVVVSRLVQSRLVERVQSPQDARRVELTLTAAGRRALKTKLILPQQRLFAALNQLPVRKLSQFRSLLEEVVTLSGMDTKRPPMFLEEGKTPREPRPLKKK